MSESTEDVFGSAPDGQTGAAGPVDTAKAEAAEVKDTTVDAAKDVAHTIKGEAGAVLDETRADVTHLYHQTRREITDQAALQQQRLSEGLHSTADDLQAMARHGSSAGIAGDVVQRIAARLDGASTWLSVRDPQGVVAEVKSFARRRPAAFIAGALIVGVVAGRLTRALASSNDADSDLANRRTTPVTTRRLAATASAPGPGRSDGLGGGDVSAAADAPLYTETASRHRGEVSDDRSDTF
ncbi:hypothetical protein [Microbacterium mangrovi]|uniref:hypothetical protein n=1 Tax=Microbacterium mangrovi TaxID=1348253 RepID=UPI0006903EF7|nr:hypothetical protein [Microbacterium mangrovi]